MTLPPTAHRRDAPRVALRAAALTALAVVTGALAFAAAPAFVVPAAMDTTQVHMPGDYFAQPVIVVHTGDTVTWINDDSDVHSVVAFPGQSVDFDIDIAGGKTGTFTFDQPGVYRYYCDLHADYDPMMQDVKAKPGMDVYPAPMRGVVVVLDTHDGMPASGTDTVDVPEETMMFTPWALTVKAGDTVTWTNHDGDLHVVATVADHAAEDLAPMTLTAETGTASYTFTQPGVYYYDCPVHAVYHASQGIVFPLESYGMFPFVMDGLIVVTPN